MSSVLLLTLCVFTFITNAEITSWSSDLLLPRAIFNGVYATTSSGELYILGGTTKDGSNGNIQPLPQSQLYKWNGQHQSIFTHLSISSSIPINELYSIQYTDFACISTKCAIAMANDIIYIIGSNYFNPINNTYDRIYNPNIIITFDTKQNSFTSNSYSLKYPSTEGCVTSDIDNNIIYYIGGINDAGNTIGYIQYINILNDNNKFTNLTSIPLNHTIAGAACLFYDDYLWIFGGYEQTNNNPKNVTISNYIWRYDIVNNEWGKSGEELSIPTTNAIAILGADNLIYIIGSGNIEIFDSKITRIISKKTKENLVNPRYSMAAVTVTSIKYSDYKQWQLVVFGGLSFNLNNTVMDMYNDIALDSMEYANFIDITTTYYPLSTLFNTIAMTNTNTIPDASESNNNNEFINERNLMYILIGFGCILTIFCLILICFRCYKCFKNKEANEYEERNRRSTAYNQYANYNYDNDNDANGDEKNNSRKTSEFNIGANASFISNQQKKKHLKKLTSDIENLEMINRMLQNTARMKDYNETDEDNDNDSVTNTNRTIITHKESKSFVQ